MVMAIPPAASTPPPVSAPAATQARPRPAREVPIWCKPFEEMVRERAEAARRTVEISERRRTRLAVTMYKRFRGDYFGYFSTRAQDRLLWRDPPSGNLKNYPLFSPVVRANATNFLNADVDLSWEAASSDPELEGGARICQSVYEHLAQLQWTESARTQMCELGQLAFNYFVHNAFDPTADDYTHKLGRTQELERQPDMAGDYICPECYGGGPVATLQGDQCPKCQTEGMQYFDVGEDGGGAEEPGGAGANQGLKTFEAPAEGYDEMPAGDNRMEVVPSFLVRVDEVNAKGCSLERAEWFNYHPLRYRYQIEQKIPNLQDLLEQARYGGGAGGAISAGTRWSESTEWWHALETSCSTPDLIAHTRSAAGASPHPDDLLEEDHWYWSAAAWESYVFPEPYALSDHEGEVVFAAEAGDTVREAFAAVGKEFCGLYVFLLGNAILSVDARRIVDEWAAGGWLMDSSSFWCKGQEDLLDFQEVVNEFMTLFFEHGMHQALPHIVVDGQMFDGLPFRNQPDKVTKTRYGMVREKPISDYIHEIKGGQLGSDVFAIFAGTLQGAKDTTGVQDSTVGKSDPTNQTFGGKTLERNQSVSLLIPSVKLQALCKIESMRQQVRYAQSWPDERLMALKGKWGDEWKKEDIAAFRRLNLRRDVLVSVVEGTDVPLESDEKFIRLINLYQSQILSDPAVPREIKQLAVKYCGLNIDLDDYDAERRSALSRLRKIDELCAYAVQSGQAWVEQPVMAPVTDPATGQPVMQPAPSAPQQQQPGGMAPPPPPSAPTAGQEQQPAPAAEDPNAGGAPPQQQQAPPMQPMMAPVMNPDGSVKTEKVINPAVVQAILSRPGIEILPRQDDHMIHMDVYKDRIRALAADEPVDTFKIRVLQARFDEHALQQVQNMVDENVAMGLAGQAEGAGAGGEDPEAADKDRQSKVDVEHQKGEHKRLDREAHAREADKNRTHQQKLQRMKSESDRVSSAIKENSNTMQARMQASASKKTAQTKGKETLARAGA
jgi:hypothetical protein